MTGKHEGAIHAICPCRTSGLRVSTTLRRVILEIDLAVSGTPVAHPAIGRWTETPTATGYRLEASLDPREFSALADALRISPAAARERNGLASLSLRPVTWPNAVAVSVHFDPALLAG
jgi:hypothetical protein